MKIKGKLFELSNGIDINVEKGQDGELTIWDCDFENEFRFADIVEFLEFVDEVKELMNNKNAR